MRAPLDDLHVGGLEQARGGGARGEEVGGGDEGGDHEGDGREEAKGVLGAHDGGVHRGRRLGPVWESLDLEFQDIGYRSIVGWTAVIRSVRQVVSSLSWLSAMLVVGS